VNLNNSHWCIAEINTDNKEAYRFVRYDSLAAPSKHAEDDKVLRVLKRYALAEVDDKCENITERQIYKTKIENASYEVGNVERQQNGYDCGVFTCGFLKNIRDQLDRMQFKQSEVKDLRGFMANLMQEKENQSIPNLTEPSARKLNIKIKEVS